MEISFILISSGKCLVASVQNAFVMELLERVILSESPESRLFIYRCTYLLADWDFPNNQHINLRSVTYGSQKKASFICHNDNEHRKTVQIKNKFGCKECNDTYKRKHIKDEVGELMKNRRQNSKNTTKIGDDAEEYIVDLLEETDNFVKVERLGYLTGTGDIAITVCGDEVVYIQIKTLYHCKLRSSNRNESKYPDDILIVFVDQKRKHFALSYWKDIKHLDNLSLSFKNKKSLYREMMFVDEEIFLNKLVDNIPLSTTENIIYESALKEIESFKRLDEKCQKRGLHFRRNDSNGDSVDVFINGKRCQGKYSNRNKNNYYIISSCKVIGKIKNKNVQDSYEEDDFDFLIAEIGGNDVGNFCIIPMKVLIERKIIKHGELNGKTAFTLLPPDLSSEKWYHQYWNNFEQFV